MGFWNKVGKIASVVIEKAPEVMSHVAQEGAKKQEQQNNELQRKFREYEQKIAKAEKSEKMKNPEYARRVSEAKNQLGKAKVKAYSGGEQSVAVKVNSAGQVAIAGKTIQQWESGWRMLGILSSLSLSDLSPYNRSIGLYKAEMGGKIYYIGRAIEYHNGGFRKRLRDYVRESNSARKHKSGQKMHENADKIQLSILVMGSSKEDVEAVKALERALVQKYGPVWNFHFNR